MKIDWKSVCTGILIGVSGTGIGLYAYSIYPDQSRQKKLTPLKEHYIAHRGLFNNHTDKPENSIPAFKSAVEHNFGIELDVQMTADGKLVVFHDDSLKRMCGVEKILSEMTYEELQHYHLLDTNETIPLFDDVLKVIDGKVPLLVEIKGSGDWLGTTQKTGRRMDSYTGFYGILSFQPAVLEWFKDNRPEVIRGQLSTDYFRDEPKRKFLNKFFLTNLLENFKSRPDMVAYNCKFKDEPSFLLFKCLFPNVTTIGWTIKSEEELNLDRRDFDCFIFDHFIPKTEGPES